MAPKQPVKHVLKNPEAVRLHFLDQLSNSSVETKRGRLFWCEKFLKYAGRRDFDDWNKALVDKFIARLKKEGYAPGTIHSAFAIMQRVFDSAKAVFEQEKRESKAKVDRTDPLRALLEIQDWDAKVGPTWTYGKRAMPRVETSDVARPTLTLEEIGKLVAAAKDGRLDPAETAYLAVASIYGLRRGELARITPEHVNLEERTIYVDTEKGGEKRKQALAPEIIPYLEAYGFSPRYSPMMISAMWKRICYKSGIEERDANQGDSRGYRRKGAKSADRENFGWHAFRRYLDTALRNSMASDTTLKIDYQLYVKIFFRWKLMASSDMSIRYYAGHPLEIDEVVLAHHPVVRLWGE